MVFVADMALFSIFAVAILLGLSCGQENGYPANSHNDQAAVRDLLGSIQNLVGRKLAQADRLNKLGDSINDNLGFSSDYNVIVQHEIADQQKQQSGQLDALASKTALLQKLIDQVKAFQQKTVAIRAALDRTAAADFPLMDTINQLQEEDRNSAEGIEVAQNRANDVRDRISPLSEKVFSNTERVRAAQLLANRIVYRLNAVAATANEVLIALHSDRFTSASTPFPGFPTEGLVYVTGYRTNKTTGYAGGIPLQDFYITSNSLISSVGVTALDFSRNGWKMDEISAVVHAFKYPVVPFLDPDE